MRTEAALAFSFDCAGGGSMIFGKHSGRIRHFSLAKAWATAEVEPSSSWVARADAFDSNDPRAFAESFFASISPHRIPCLQNRHAYFLFSTIHSPPFIHIHVEDGAVTVD